MSATNLLQEDPDPQDVLHLATSVACASSPHTSVLSCSSCQAREVRGVETLCLQP